MCVSAPQPRMMLPSAAVQVPRPAGAAAAPPVTRPRRQPLAPATARGPAGRSGAAFPRPFPLPKDGTEARNRSNAARARGIRSREHPPRPRLPEAGLYPPSAPCHPPALSPPSRGPGERGKAVARLEEAGGSSEKPSMNSAQPRGPGPASAVRSPRVTPARSAAPGPLGLEVFNREWDCPGGKDSQTFNDFTLNEGTANRCKCGTEKRQKAHDS